MRSPAGARPSDDSGSPVVARASAAREGAGAQLQAMLSAQADSIDVGAMREAVEEMIDDAEPFNLVIGWARAFIDAVDWNEIWRAYNEEK